MKWVIIMPKEKEITLNEIKEGLNSLETTLREILRWARFENFPKLRKILLDTLKTREEKLAYELTDGERSRYDVAKEMNLPDSTIRSWWERWYNLGILEPSGRRKGRPQKIMSLEDMGIEIPKTPEKVTEQEKKEAEGVVKKEPIGEQEEKT